jgi:hypothetical protein
MDAIKFNVTGPREVGLRLDEFPNGLYDDLLHEIESLTNEAFARVVAKTPSRTGKLRSEERVRIFADKQRISGRIDVDAPKGSEEFAKAGALEYGAHHARGEISAHAMKLDHAWSQRLGSPIHVMVAAHARPPNIAEVAFERGTLAEMQPEILAGLNEVIAKRVAEANR